VTPRLLCVRGPLAGVLFELVADQVGVGRHGGNGLAIPDPWVSRRHAILSRQGDRFAIRDLGSRHGTLVNGEMRDQHVLAHGDRLTLGHSVFVYHGADADDTRGHEVSLEMDDSGTSAGPASQVALAEALPENARRLLGDSGDPSRVAHLEVVRGVAEAIGSIREIDALAHALLERVLMAVPAERGAILLIARSSAPEAAPRFAPTFAWTREAGALGPLRVSRTVASRVIADGVAVLCNGVRDSADWAGATSLQDARVRSVLCVPIMLFARPLGVLYLDSSRPDARFDEDHLSLVTTVAGLAALPFDSARHADRLDGEDEDGADERNRAEAVEAARLAAEAGAGAARMHTAPMLARVPTAAPPPVPAVRGRVAVVLVPDAPLHLGTVLELRRALELLPEREWPRSVLVLDIGSRGAATMPGAVADAVLDRLAMLPPPLLERVALVSSVPAVLRLTAQLAALLEPPRDLETRAWFRDVLLAAALVASRATHVFAEGGADPGERLALARRLAGRLNKILPGACPPPAPLVSGLGTIAALDGSGAMGASAKGAILLSDDAEAAARKVRQARTDARPILDPREEIGEDVRNLLLLHAAVTGEPMAAVLQRFAGKGYGVLKGDLAERVNAHLEPLRRRRAELAARQDLGDVLLRVSGELEASGRELALSLQRAPDALA
jgi:hypothetical protein